MYKQPNIDAGIREITLLAVINAEKVIEEAQGRTSMVKTAPVQIGIINTCCATTLTAAPTIKARGISNSHYTSSTQTGRRKAFTATTNGIRQLPRWRCK
ncbi:hypothetical protein QZM72_30480 [Burkholderia sp. AU45388]|nr:MULTISPECIES: hypothetical protein [unclassified Burkholderia]MDN7430633.1 hypothetical protein [Burkholderia sp. AU45388]